MFQLEHWQVSGDNTLYGIFAEDQTKLLITIYFDSQGTSIHSIGCTDISSISGETENEYGIGHISANLAENIVELNNCEKEMVPTVYPQILQLVARHIEKRI